MRHLQILGSALAVMAAALSAAAPASAGDSNGNFQAKLGITGAWTDDETNSLTLNGAELTPGSWATSNDTVIPTLTLAYYFNRNIAIELFCCFDKVHVDAEGAQAGLGTIAETWIFPPILTLQYHFDGMGAFRPFVGVGAEWIHYFHSKSKGGAAAAASLNLPDVDFDDSFGVALQAGFDYDLGGGWSFGLDVKKVWEDTKITWTGGGGTLIADHDIDPLFVTANLGYRFNLSDLFGRRSEAAPMK